MFTGFDWKSYVSTTQAALTDIKISYLVNKPSLPSPIVMKYVKLHEKYRINAQNTGEE